MSRIIPPQVHPKLHPMVNPTVPPKVSVIMAVYNTEEYLAQSIEAILHQTFKNFELIVINDCSSDASLAILHQFQKKDPRIILLNNNKRMYPAGTRNRGLRVAKGDYIAIQDADDIALPQRLEKQCDVMDKHKYIFLLGTQATIIDPFGRKVNTVEPPTEEEKLRRDLTNRNALCHSSVMFRNVGYLYRPKMRYAHDYDLYLRMLSDGRRISCIPRQLVLYRLTPGSISQAYMVRQILFREKAKEFYRQRQKNGKIGHDSYGEFNLKTFLDKSSHLSREKEVLELCIKKSFTINEHDKTRLFLKKYFQNYGFLNRYLLYGLLVHLPIALITLIRNTKHLAKRL